MDKEQMIIRRAMQNDARQIAEIIVEDWKNAYRGIIDDDFLDSMSVEAVNEKIMGLTWNEINDSDDSDCEIIALYVKYEERKSGIGRGLFLDSVEEFKSQGKKRMIIWCLKENYEARKFYEKMGGLEYKHGTHKWGNRDYDMISYTYNLNELER